MENDLRYIFCCFSVVDAVTSDIKSELPALNELIVAFAEAGSVKHAKKLVEVMRLETVSVTIKYCLTYVRHIKNYLF